MSDFSHTDSSGKARMVDVSDKETTLRTARASVVVKLDQPTFERVKENEIEKGDVLSVARLAGIQAAKKQLT